MPNYGYSFEGYDAATMVRASGRNLRVSAKNTREVTNAIKGMRLQQAKRFLEEVILEQSSVPFKRHKKKVGHRRQSGRWRWPTGRFPVKSARMVYEILMNAEANAEYKTLDPERLKIIHAATNRGRKIKRYIERAHGRSTPYFKQLTHIEVVLEEMPEY